MATDLYFIDGPWPGKLAVASRPRGGDWLDDEVDDWREKGFQAVCSLLTSGETDELQLDREAELCRSAGMQFLSYPIPDMGLPPSMPTALAVVREVEGLLLRGESVAVHCRQGIGRSGLVAASLLILAGTAVEEAVQRVTEARGLAIPETPEQRQWLDSFAHEIESSMESSA